MSRRINIIGQSFNRWTVLHFSKIVNKKTMYVCECDCGTITEVDGLTVRHGTSKSCGCYKNEQASKSLIERSTTHGLSHTSEYKIWKGIIKRCTNPNSSGYHKYGGRGITICKRWLNSFENFYADMEPRPSKNHSIDRINNNGSYHPDNCRWATAKEQANNRRPRNSNRKLFD